MFEKQINSLQFCTLLVYISFKDCFSNSVFSVINIQSKLFFFFCVCVCDYFCAIIKRLL